MSPDQERLVADFLAGTLDPADDRRLAEAFDRDPDLRREVRALMQVEDLVYRSLHPESSAQAMAQALRVRCASEGRELPHISTRRLVRPPAPRPRRTRSSRPRTRVPQVALAAGGVLVLAVVGLLLALRPATPPPAAPAPSASPAIAAPGPAHPESSVSVDAIVGNVQLERAGEERVVDAALALLPGDVLRLGPGAHATLGWDDGSRVRLDGDGRVRLPTDAGLRLRLDRGTLVAAIVPREEPFAIATPQGRAQVLGTRFRLSATATDTRLAVREGRVRLIAADEGSSAVIAAGEAAVCRDTVQRLALDAGLVGYWPLDEGAGRDVGGPAGTPTGRTHNAEWQRVGDRAVLVFDGVDDYVELPLTPELDAVNYGDYSISVRFHPLSPQPGGRDPDSQVVVGRTGWTLGLYYTNERRFLMQDFQQTEPRSRWATSESSYPLERTYHLTGVVDRRAGTTTLYVDGERVDHRRYALDGEPHDYGEATWKIGISNPRPREERFTWPTHGVIADLRIYDRALSDAEIAAIAGLDALGGPLVP